jgi:hypothetical protein
VRCVTFAQFTFDEALAAPVPAAIPTVATLAKVTPASRTDLILFGAICNALPMGLSSPFLWRSAKHYRSVTAPAMRPTQFHMTGQSDFGRDAFARSATPSGLTATVITRGFNDYFW